RAVEVCHENRASDFVDPRRELDDSAGYRIAQRPFKVVVIIAAGRPHYPAAASTYQVLWIPIRCAMMEHIERARPFGFGPFAFTRPYAHILCLRARGRSSCYGPRQRADGADAAKEASS